MKKTKSENEIVVGTNLTIDCIELIKEKFDREFSTTTTLKLTGKAIQQIDLTGIQFLMYCNQKASKHNKIVTLDITFEKEQINLLNKSGFTPILEKLLG